MVCLCNSSRPGNALLPLRLSPEFRAPAARRASGHSPLPHQSPRGPGLSARSVPAKDPEAQAWLSAFGEGLRQLGWPQRYAAVQTTNSEVRSSNLFGRATTILRDIAAEWRAIAVSGRRSPHEELAAGRFGLSRLGQDLGPSWFYRVDISDFEKVEARFVAILP